jgi:hypothetical protein
MKRKLLFVAPILCFVFIASTSLAAPVLSVGDYLGNPGDTIQASIDISGITTEEIADFSFTLFIVPEDGGLLIGSPANVAKGGAIGGNTTAGGIPGSDYSISFLGNANFFDPNYLTDGTMFTFDLSVIGTGSWDLVLSDVVFGGLFGNQIDVMADNGTVGSPVPIPSAILLLGGGLIGLIGIRRRKS